MDTVRLLERCGAKKIPASRHRVYVLNGVRFTLHNGTKELFRELPRLRSQLRKLGCKV